MGSFLYWKSRRLRRAVRCTLFAEAMASRAALAAGTWLRQLAMEIVVESYKGTDSVLKQSDDEYGDFLCLRGDRLQEPPQDRRQVWPAAGQAGGHRGFGHP